MSRIRADRYTNREGTGAPTFSEGVNVVGVTSMSGDLAVTNGTITGPSQLTISGITSSISDTAVDIFVYDTSKDSDGGAWRKRTQNTSWYNETLGTSVRGTRKEFPAVAVIVCGTDGSNGYVHIYDGDDPDLPMWMVFSGGNTAFLYTTPTSVAAINGMIFVGTPSYGLPRYDFIGDTIGRYRAGSYQGYKSPTSIKDRSESWIATISAPPFDTAPLVNDNINDVAMTVLPNAPIDDTTGLPVPTIAVGTDGGLSVITDSGSVFDIVYTNNEITVSVAFNSSGNLNFVQHDNDVQFVNVPVPTQDYADNTAGTLISLIGGSAYHTGNSISGNAQSAILGDVVNDTLPNATSGPSGLTFISNETPTGYLQGAVAYATASYNTGWMHGDIKGAFLSDTDTTNKTNGQTDPDRSVNNNSLNVTGTITRTAVATGAELVAYSGFSGSNYLEQPYNSDLAPGTGVYSVVAWFKTGPTAADQYIFDRSSDGSPRALMLIRASNGGNPNTIQFYHQNAAGTNTDLTTTDITVTDDVWHHVVGLFDGSVYRVYIDGRASTITGSPVRDVDNTDSPVLKVGIRYSNTAPMTGNIALFRWSKSAPSPEQIKKIYEDEKVLFQENAKATLYGSSDAVTALAYDDTTELLHVGTSAGRSEFQGLRRINNTTVGITTAISASNELVAEQ